MAEPEQTTLHSLIAIRERSDTHILVTLEHERGQALYGFARRLGLTDDEAHDAVQETFLRLWRELQRGVPVEDSVAWSFRTLYRIGMDTHRLRRRVHDLADRLGMRADSASPPSPDDDDRRAVWAEVARLPERQRHLLYLRYRADLPFEQAAAALGMTSGAARTMTSRALHQLRERLAEPKGVL
jgi:RNA polymerase sigma-70 factor (ECF subfamily)